MKIDELKELLDGLEDDRYICATMSEDVFGVGKIIVEKDSLTNTEYLVLVEFDSYKHNRYLTIEDLKCAISEMADNVLVYVKLFDRTWQPNRFENGKFYVNW